MQAETGLGVREESHLDDMRAAIRGDFERLAKRRGGQELMRDPVALEEPAEAEPEPVPEREPAPVQPEPEPAPEHVASAEPEHPDELPPPEAELEPEAPVEEEPRRGFLDRLLGR